MCTKEGPIREPIKVNRKAITVARDAGWHLGGWVKFRRPNEKPPRVKLGKGERVLWCPYCGAWSVFTADIGETDRWICLGYCGGFGTRDFYTRTYNDLWFEGGSSSNNKPKKK